MGSIRMSFLKMSSGIL
ncbi:hypothetical protein Gotri_021218 [Gossypium trilobum]|uniref:Uncharacterized protein n=1 Tax=Gossypium trilobum TaxID=34281 RepID=A0A7J9DBV1_9ROSI|nr:hypothetical protein [Gossypium trilobum]